MTFSSARAETNAISETQFSTMPVEIAGAVLRGCEHMGPFILDI